MIHSWWMRERLQSLLDGELSEARQAAMVEHVGRCARCASALHGMAACDRRLISCRPVPGGLSPEASLALLERVMVEARVQRSGPRRGMTLLGWGFAGLLAIAASSAAAWWYHPGPPGHSGALQSPRIAAQSPDALTPDRLEAVFGSGPFDTDATAGHASRKPSKASLGESGHASRRKNDHPPRVDARHGEPRIRSRRLPSHRLIAAVDPFAHPLLLNPVRTSDERLDPYGMRMTGERSTESADEQSPTASGVDRRHEQPGEWRCDREAVRLVSAALDGDTGALQRVAEALVEDRPEALDPASLPPDGPPEAKEPELTIAEWPLPWEDGRWETEDGRRETGDGRRQFDKVKDRLPLTLPDYRLPSPVCRLPSPQLLVMVSSEPAPSAVTVTDAPEDKPGYSRAIACRPDASGHETWLQATASTEDKGTQTALVMLGEEVWDW